jgi:AraC family transcriptional regulator of adaptative response/methylated-DNA-[protein]-cysteine methyltransferase
VAGHAGAAALTPCHRVIRKAGDFGDYRWGITRKRALVGREAATRDISANAALSAA